MVDRGTLYCDIVYLLYEQADPEPQSAQTVTAEAFLGGLAVLDPDRFVLQKRVVCSKRGTAPASQYVAFGGGVEAGNIK